MQRQFIRRRYDSLFGEQVYADGLAVGSVFPKFERPGAGTEEIQLHRNVARVAVGERAEKPPVAVAADDDYVFADRAVEHAGIVPDGGNDFQEIESGLIPVVAGMIGGVNDRTFQTDKQGKFRAAGPLHLCGPDVEPELTERHVEKTARRE